MKIKTPLIVGGAITGALVFAFMRFHSWKGTGTNTRAGTFTGWLLNAIGLKKDAGYQ